MNFCDNLKIFTDERGQHTKIFERKLSEDNGFNEVHEIFMTKNKLHTLRGMHFQSNPNQQKLTKVITGRFNIRVLAKSTIPAMRDKCTSFERYKDWYIYRWDNATSATDPIFIPAFALFGYLSLEDDSRMLYIADSEFSAAGDNGYSPLAYEAPLNWLNGMSTTELEAMTTPIIISQRDRDGISLD